MWLVAAALLPLFVLLIGIVLANSFRERERVGQEVRVAAHAMALAVDRELQGRIASLEALAMSANLAARDLRGFRREVEALLGRHYPDAAVALFAPDGQQLVNTLLPEDAILPKRPNLAGLDAAIKTRRPVVADVFMATVQNAPIVSLDVPVFGSDGEVTAVLSMAPSLGVFAAVIAQQHLEPGWRVSLLDRQGARIARVPDRPSMIGLPASDRLRAQVASAPDGLAETSTRTGERMLRGWSRSGAHGWTVSVGIPTDLLFAPLWHALTVSLTLSLFAVVGALVLARQVAGRIAKPVRGLLALAASPDMPRPPGATLGLREADTVAVAFVEATSIRRAAEQQLRDALARGRAELEELVRDRTAELRAAQASLLQAQRMEALGQLTAGIAHEFNNLLQAQMSGLELLREAVLGNGRATRYVDGVHATAQRGAKLTHSLLAFSRRQVLRPERVDVPELLHGLGELLARLLGPQITLRIDVQAGLPAPMADPPQLEAALLNLCLNARDAMRERGGCLRVEASVASGGEDTLKQRRVIFAVSDEGIGMDAATLERACEPFFTTKPVGAGSGLGLSMVQGFARQSGGELRIQSKPDVGTRVEIWLPQAVSTAHVTTVERAENATSLSAEHDEGALTVLLVDDDETVRELVGELLREAGFAVTQAACGEDAVRLLDAGAFDVLVTDFAMPGMSGLELVRQAQRLDPGQPALIITGFAKFEALAVTPAHVEVLHKPFRRDELASRVRRLAQSGELAVAEPAARAAA